MRRAKGFQVLWAETAARDLGSIVDQLSLDSLDRAEQALLRIRTAASRLKSFPQRGRIVPELREQGVFIYRELVLAPWRIVFRIERRAVTVLAVFDGRRNLEDLLLERFLQ